MALSKQGTSGRAPLAAAAQGDGALGAGTDWSVLVAAILDAVRDGAYAVDPDLLDALEAHTRFSATAGGRLLEPVGLTEIQKTHVPSAQDELDAVVLETETAANTIMGAMEQIEGLVGQLDEKTLAQVSEQVMNIYQACSFQDITGQRIIKVGKTLKDIEFVADSTLGSLGDESACARIEAALTDRGQGCRSLEEEADLLNGPQLEGGGNGQDEIDNILASFD